MMKKELTLPFRVSPLVLHVDEEGCSLPERNGDGGDVAVIFVTGDAVGSRRYDASDPIVRRIEANADLYVSVHDGTMDYVRKAVVDSAAEGLGCKVIGVVVCSDMDSADVDGEVQAARHRRLSVSALRHDMPLADHLASRLLKRILLPVLLVYLAVLLANFFIHSALTERLGEVRSEYARESVEAKRRSEVTQAQERLFTEYESVPDVGMSGLSDVVAAHVPYDMRLTSLSFKASHARICGDAFTSEAVMLFVDRLRERLECESVNVAGLEKDRKEDVFRFEIHVML